jgi:hypothetical protein
VFTACTPSALRGFIENFGHDGLVADPSKSDSWLYVPGPGTLVSVCRPWRALVPKPHFGGISEAAPWTGLYAPGPGDGGALLSKFLRPAAVNFGPTFPPVASYVPGPGVIDRRALMDPRPAVPKPNFGVTWFGS